MPSKKWQASHHLNSFGGLFPAIPVRVVDWNPKGYSSSTAKVEINDDAQGLLYGFALKDSLIPLDNTNAGATGFLDAPTGV